MKTTSNIEFAAELRNVLVRLIKKLRRESPTGQSLSMTERSTLSLLQQHKALLPNELAAMEMITKQSMSQVLSHLLELGFITRTVSQTDGRKVIIELSQKGEETLVQFRQERDEWLSKSITAVCTPEEQALLRRVIVPLTKLVDYK